MSRTASTIASFTATDAVNPNESGTKAAAHYVLTLSSGESATLKIRLTDSQTSSVVAE